MLVKTSSTRRSSGRVGAVADMGKWAGGGRRPVLSQKAPVADLCRIKRVRRVTPESGRCPDPPGQTQRVSVNAHHDDLARRREHARQRGDVHLVRYQYQRMLSARLFGDQRAGGAGLLRLVAASGKEGIEPR